MRCGRAGRSSWVWPHRWSLPQFLAADFPLVIVAEDLEFPSIAAGLLRKSHTYHFCNAKMKEAQIEPGLGWP